jgi:hypothetical protein
MGIPSGGGTEVLKQAYIQGLSNTKQKIIDGGDADYIYTVLNIIFTETAGNAEELHITIYPSANSGNETAVLTRASLPAYGTYIWNEKLVLTGTDELLVETGGSANVDVICNYILQDFS